MGDEFYSILKLVSGEEIFALVCVDESEDEPILILHNPIKMKPLHPQSNQLNYIKVTPWMELSEEDMFVLRMDKVITMTCLLYTSPSPRDLAVSRMPSSA